MEAFEKKPSSIREAIKADDGATLSAAGRKGAEVVNEKRAKEREQQEVLAAEAAERAAGEEAELRRSTNEDILSADGEDFDLAPEDRYS